MNDIEDMPEGWVRFNMIRGAEDSEEVVCFGFFEGTVEDLRALHSRPNERLE